MSEEITGIQRVAAFVLSLEPHVASAVLKSMSDDVVPEIAQAMLDLDPRLADPGRVEAIYTELSKSLNGPRGVLPCNRDELSTLLALAYDAPTSARVLQDIEERRGSGRPFEAIENASGSAIARVLGEESASVMAVVMAHLDPSKSAEVLSFLDKEEALDVVRRMATLKAPEAKILATLAADLTPRVVEASAGDAGDDPAARLRTIADVLSHSSSDLEQGVIQSLAEKDEEMAAELRELMFTWEDIATIDKRSMQKILGTVDTKTLSMSLKACSEAVESNVLDNLSSRVREMVAEERELLGPVPMSEVDMAREEVMRNIRAMIEAGEFKPSRAGEDLVA